MHTSNLSKRTKCIYILTVKFPVARSLLMVPLKMTGSVLDSPSRVRATTCLLRTRISSLRRPLIRVRPSGYSLPARRAESRMTGMPSKGQPYRFRYPRLDLVGQSAHNRGEE